MAIHAKPKVSSRVPQRSGPVLTLLALALTTGAMGLIALIFDLIVRAL
jgi:hypothetical protein